MNKSTQQIKSILAARGLHYADLARDTGLALGTVQNIACGSSQSRSGRAKIERILGVQVFPRPVANPPASKPLSSEMHRPCTAPAIQAFNP